MSGSTPTSSLSAKHQQRMDEITDKLLTRFSREELMESGSLANMLLRARVDNYFSALREIEETLPKLIQFGTHDTFGGFSSGKESHHGRKIGFRAAQRNSR